MNKFKTIRNCIYKTAFTLAEVLIVLGIIGIVAEMTIPTLMNNVQNAATVAQVKNSFAILSQAYTLAVKDNGTPDQWGLTAGDGNGANIALNTLSPYLKILTNCGTNNGCFANAALKTLNGNWDNISTTTYYSKAILANGSAIALYVDSASCSAFGADQRCGWIYVDVNGYKNPNTVGKDGFFFAIEKNRLVPFGLKDETHETFDNACKSSGGYFALGAGCAAWVVYNGNMDYLNSCSNSLSWNGPYSCN